MDSPWVVASLTLFVFLTVHLVMRLLMWSGEIRAWTVVSAWNLDSTHSGQTSVRLRLPAPGYQVAKRGKRFRGQRVGRGGKVVATFRTRRHMGDALRDCWADFEEEQARYSTGALAGSGTRGSTLPGGDGTLHTA